ncbi:MAG: hypothetical protein KGJ90_06200 [Patescibacteria group bacterium]|nr:hypothetical protein [Patescibacteria group bacterium]
MEKSTRRIIPTGDDHVLPVWVNFILDNFLLTFLILAEGYLLGTLMTIGWVGDIESPSQWGVFHGIGVVLFFCAGATAAGIALRSSIAAISYFKRRQWGFAMFNMLGLVAFSAVEIWASLSERSTHLMPTPADTALLHVLGFPTNAPISPTIVMVALLLPFATIYYGFSQQIHAQMNVSIQPEKKEQPEDKVLSPVLPGDSDVSIHNNNIIPNRKRARIEGISTSTASARNRPLRAVK